MRLVGPHRIVRRGEENALLQSCAPTCGTLIFPPSVAPCYRAARSLRHLRLSCPFSLPSYDSVPITGSRSKSQYSRSTKKTYLVLIPVFRNSCFATSRRKRCGVFFRPVSSVVCPSSDTLPKMRAKYSWQKINNKTPRALLPENFAAVVGV